MTLKFHPLANLFPLMRGKEYDNFAAGIRERGGLVEKIVILDGMILDGRNRFRACIDAEFFTESVHPNTGRWFVDFEDLPREVVELGPLDFVIAKNCDRRHLNESQRAMVAARLANMPAHRPADKSANLQTSQTDAAKRMHVSLRLVAAAKSIQDKGSAKLVEAVDSGKVVVSLAAAAARLPEEQQAEVVAEIEAGHANAVRTVLKRNLRAEKERLLGEKQRALPDRKYGAILADPEWRFEPQSRATGMDRAPENHYPTSETVVIAARPVQSIAADDSVLLLWVPAPMIEHGLLVMSAWGFTYKSQLIWHKLREGRQRGTGYWFTGEHEVLLLGTRGHPPGPAPGTQWPSVIEAHVGEHSEKPDVVYELVEEYFPNLPKIELNARGARKGWAAWGNEAPDLEDAA